MSDIAANSEERWRLAFKDIDAAPKLRRVNGSGLTLFGTMRDPRIAPYVVKMYWFTFLFLPLLPIRCYLVREMGGDGFGFSKRIGLVDFHRVFWRRLPRFYLFMMLEALAGVLAFAAVIALIIFVVALKRGFR